MTQLITHYKHRGTIKLIIFGGKTVKTEKTGKAVRPRTSNSAKTL